MKIRITMDIFSGRPNPVIELEGSQAKAVLDRIELKTPLKRPTSKTPPPPFNLGYRGLLVEQLDGATKGLPPAFQLAVDQLYVGEQSARVSAEGVEELLYDQLGKFSNIGSDKEFRGLFTEQLKLFRDSRIKMKIPLDNLVLWPWTRPTPCHCAPIYEPGWWNDSGQRQFGNNCYNYACNYRTDTFAQPGRASSRMYTYPAGLGSCNPPVPEVSARQGAISDDLIDLPGNNNKCICDNGHLVALVIAPFWDFHWYRKGADGYWSHKPGGTAVTNLDNSGHLIADPRTADRGPYTDFCTFMKVLHGHIKIN